MVKSFRRFILLFLSIMICCYLIPVNATASTAYIEKADGSGYVTYRGSNQKVEVNSEYVYLDTEFRAVWVTALTGNIDRFSSEAQYKKEILKVFETMEYYNMNAMIFHIRMMNDAFYKSQYNNWSIYYSTDPSWEALPWIIEECHKRGFEFHAWMNPYRVTNNVERDLESIAADFPANNPASNPANLLKGANSVILDPGIPEVRKFLIDTCMEVVRNYDVDAIHFDDYFYDKNVDDTTTRDKYNINNLSLGDFRRKQVDTFIETLHRNISDYNIIANKNVQLGISPSGVWKSGNGVVTYDNEGNAVTTGSNTSSGAFAHYDNYLYSDTLKWINEEWIDYILPQTYWAIEHTSCPYADLMKWWNDVVKYKDVSLYSGVAVYQAYSTSGSSWYTNELEGYNETMICNTLENVDGISIYDYEYLELSIKNPNKGFKGMKDVWNKPAILPEIKGANPVVLNEVTNFSAQKNPVGNLLSWDDNEAAKFYVIYRSEKPLTYDITEVVDIIGHLSAEGKVEYTDTTAEKGKSYYYGVRVQSSTNTLNNGVSAQLDLNETQEYSHLGDFTRFGITDGIVPGSNITVRFDELSYPFGGDIKYSVSYSFNDRAPVVGTTFVKDGADQLYNIIVPYDATKMKVVLTAENSIGKTIKVVEKDIIKGLGKINGFTFTGDAYANGNGKFSWQSFEGENVVYWIQYSYDLVNWKNRDYILHTGKSVLELDVTLQKETGRVYYRVYAKKGEEVGYSDVVQMDLKNHLGEIEGIKVNNIEGEKYFTFDKSKNLTIEFDKLEGPTDINYTLYVSYDQKEWIPARNYNSNIGVDKSGDTVIIKLPFNYSKLKLYVKIVASTNNSHTESEVMTVHIKIDGTFYDEVLPYFNEDLQGFVNGMDIYN